LAADGTEIACRNGQSAAANEESLIVLANHRTYLRAAITVILVVALCQTTLAQSSDEKKKAFTRPRLHRQEGLASGMFPEVLWPVRRSEPTLFVPASTVARSTEATFVIRIRDGKAEWVNVQTGELDGTLLEVFGDVHAGEEVALRGTDDVRPGSAVSTKLASLDFKPSAK
jgi:hypothetical protein